MYGYLCRANISHSVGCLLSYSHSHWISHVPREVWTQSQAPIYGHMPCISHDPREVWTQSQGSYMATHRVSHMTQEKSGHSSRSLNQLHWNSFTATQFLYLLHACVASTNRQATTRNISLGVVTHFLYFFLIFFLFCFIL